MTNPLSPTNLLSAVVAAVDLQRPWVDMERGHVLTRAEFFSWLAVRQVGLREKVPDIDGATVLVETRRGAAYWIDLLAVWGLGGTVVPLDLELSRENVEYIIELTHPIAVIGQRGVADESVTCIETLESVNDGEVEALIAVEVGEDDLASIVFTSGSTGRPKGVRLPHRVLLGNARATASVLAPDPEDRLFINIPFHFISAISHFLTAGLGGMQFVGVEEKLLPGDFLKRLEESRANCFGGSPLQIRWISEYLAAGHAGEQSLDWLMSSGDHLPREVISDLLPHLPEKARLFVVYGLTELGGRFCVLPPDRLEDKLGSVGVPIEGLSVAVRDGDTLESLPPGEEGEVYASGDWLFDGYLSSDPSVNDVFDEYGFRTGDLGWLDDDGLLWLTGRSDDVFKVSGLKVSAVKIVDALLQLEHIRDAAVVPWELPNFGTVPAAILVMEDGAEFRKADVVTELREHLPSNHLPSLFYPVESVPRTGSGKVRRVEVRKILEERLR